MTPELIKIGLERYSQPTLDPNQCLTTVVVGEHPNCTQVALIWHDIAARALEYIEQMELRIAEVRELQEGRQVWGLHERIYSAESHAEALLQRNNIQAESIQLLTAQLRSQSEKLYQIKALVPVKLNSQLDKILRSEKPA